MLPPRLVSLGFSPAWATRYAAAQVPLILAARVIGEQRGWYNLGTEAGDGLATISGLLRNGVRLAESERPAVGDWVALRPQEAGAPPWPRQIEAVLPRQTLIVRRTAGRSLKQQILASNVDWALVVVALSEPFSLRRLERFVAIVRDGGVQPVVLLSKSDCLVDAQATAATLVAAQGAVGEAPVHLLSVRAGTGLAALAPYLQPPATLVLLGTSGAGKTTLLNHWLGRDQYTTGAVQADGRGRHTTRARQLAILPSVAVVIDTPGLREIGLHSADEGVAAAFADIEALAQHCRFNDCAHAAEPGCAISAAVVSGALAAGRLDSYQRLRAECAPGTAAIRPPPPGSRRRPPPRRS